MAMFERTWLKNRSVSNSVIATVAEAEDRDPTEISPPLYEVINPEALDQLFAATPTTGRMSGEVRFSYKGYEVTVSGDGYVSVEQ